jgi:hypothetical protein
MAREEASRLDGWDAGPVGSKSVAASRDQPRRNDLKTSRVSHCDFQDGAPPVTLGIVERNSNKQIAARCGAERKSRKPIGGSYEEF